MAGLLRLVFGLILFSLVASLLRRWLRLLFGLPRRTTSRETASPGGEMRRAGGGELNVRCAACGTALPKSQARRADSMREATWVCSADCLRRLEGDPSVS